MKLFETPPVTYGAGNCEELDEAAYTDRTRRVRNTNSHDRCCLSVPVSGAVKTVTSYSKDRELHNGWRTTVRFLAGEQILSSHYHVVENSGAQDSVQRCQRFLIQGYSTQSKMLITYIHVMRRSRTLGALTSCIICVQTDKNRIIACARHLVYSYCRGTEWDFGHRSFSVDTAGSRDTWSCLVVTGQCVSSLRFALVGPYKDRPILLSVRTPQDNGHWRRLTRLKNVVMSPKRGSTRTSTDRLEFSPACLFASSYLPLLLLVFYRWVAKDDLGSSTDAFSEIIIFDSWRKFRSRKRKACFYN
jgi:hypothetical protein